MNPKFSILVPTRNRSQTLKFTLRSILSQTFPDFELIVIDNFSSDDTEDVVLQLKDSRVRYVSPDRPLSMSDNWEFGLSKASGEWVTIIGADDGLLPEALSSVFALINDDTHAILTNYVFFRWPDQSDLRTTIHVPAVRGHETKATRVMLNRLLVGELSYYKLPHIYTGGFVRRSLVDSIRCSDEGKFFHSCVPDVYSAIRLSLEMKSFVYVHDPLAIVGISGQSTGSGRKKDYVPLQNFMKENSIAFHSDVPMHGGIYPPSINALVYECYLQAARFKPVERHLDRRHQLKYILSTPLDFLEIGEYGKLYAKHHGMTKYAVFRASAYAKLIRLSRIPSKVLRRLLDRIFSTLVVERSDFSVLDVDFYFRKSLNQLPIPTFIRGLSRNFNN